MIVVKGKTYKSLNSWAVKNSPPHTVWAWQPKALMENVLGEHWFRNCFLKHCRRTHLQLLILDGHSSHESLGLLEAAKAATIHVFSLPPHTTHDLQPLDKTVFGSLKKHYNAKCSEYMVAHPDHKIDKQSWPALFASSLEAGVSPANLISGFQACGIYPFNPNIIGEHGYAPSLALGISAPSNISQNTDSKKYITDVFLGMQAAFQITDGSQVNDLTVAAL